MAKIIEFHPEAIKTNREERKAAREKRKAEGGKKLGIGAKIGIAASCIAAGAGATYAAIKLCTKDPQSFVDVEIPMEEDMIMEPPAEIVGTEVEEV